MPRRKSMLWLIRREHLSVHQCRHRLQMFRMAVRRSVFSCLVWYLPSSPSWVTSVADSASAYGGGTPALAFQTNTCKLTRAGVQWCGTYCRSYEVEVEQRLQRREILFSRVFSSLDNRSWERLVGNIMVYTGVKFVRQRRRSNVLQSCICH